MHAQGLSTILSPLQHPKRRLLACPDACCSTPAASCSNAQTHPTRPASCLEIGPDSSGKMPLGSFRGLSQSAGSAGAGRRSAHVRCAQEGPLHALDCGLCAVAQCLTGRSTRPASDIDPVRRQLWVDDRASARQLARWISSSPQSFGTSRVASMRRAPTLRLVEGRAVHPAPRSASRRRTPAYRIARQGS